MNHFAATHPGIGLLSSYWYSSAHYLVTPLVLAWLFVRHRPGYCRPAARYWSPRPSASRYTWLSQQRRPACSMATPTCWPCTRQQLVGADASAPAVWADSPTSSRPFPPARRRAVGGNVGATMGPGLLGALGRLATAGSLRWS